MLGAAAAGAGTVAVLVGGCWWKQDYIVVSCCAADGAFSWQCQFGWYDPMRVLGVWGLRNLESRQNTIHTVRSPTVTIAVLDAGLVTLRSQTRSQVAHFEFYDRQVAAVCRVGLERCCAGGASGDGSPECAGHKSLTLHVLRHSSVGSLWCRQVAYTSVRSTPC